MHSKTLNPVFLHSSLETKGLIKMTFKISLAQTFCSSPSMYLGLRVPDFFQDKKRQCKETSEKKAVLK